MKYIFIVLATLLLVSGCSVCDIEKIYGKEAVGVSNSVNGIRDALETGDSDKYLSFVSLNSDYYQDEVDWINYWKENDLKLDSFEYTTYEVYYDVSCPCLRANVEVSMSIYNETYSESYTQNWFMGKRVSDNKWVIY